MFFVASVARYAQYLPEDYRGVVKILDKKADYKSDVRKVNISRDDLQVTIDGASTPTSFGFGGWLAVTKGDGGDSRAGLVAV